LCGENNQEKTFDPFKVKIEIKMSEPATAVKLFGKWGLDETEINDLSLVVSEKSVECLKLFHDICVAFRTSSPSRESTPHSLLTLPENTKEKASVRLR
jgi:hypothetical protein